MAVKLAPIFNDAQFINAIPANGALLFTYAAGSSTKQNTYTGIDGLTAQANPIVLNSRGEPASPVWLTAGQAYKFVFAPSTDSDPPVSPIRTIDNVSGVNDTSLTIDQWVDSGLTPTYVSATSFTLAGDQTTAFHVNRRLKFTVTAGTVYSYIAASVFGALTTVTVVLDSGNLDSGLSAVQLGLLTADNPSSPILKDSNFRVSGSADKTKRLAFEVDTNVATATTRTLTIQDKDITVAGLADFAGYIYGLNCSSAADTIHDITIASGQCINSTNTTSMTLAASLTKQIDAAWAVGNNLGGMFTGAVAANTTYYLFLIRRSDTGVVDAGWDTSITAANKPASYDSFRLIMSLKTDGSSQIRPFEQNGNGSEREIRYFTPVLDANNVANTTTYISQALSVPAGKRFKAFGNVTRAGSVAAIVQIRPPSASDGAPSITASPLGGAAINSAVSSSTNQWACHTDTSSQVQTATSAAANIYMTTEGYREYL